MPESPYSIAVVGCGGLGSRHVEALGRLVQPAVVYGIDPNPEALVRARDLFCNSRSSAHTKNEFIAGEEIKGLPAHLDLAIVATRAGDRLRALQRLVECCEVEHFVLEKFLFSRREDYAEAGRLLESHSSRVWVNCPRRVYPGYERVAQLLRNDGFVRIDVTCNAFRAPLGTIGIHFVDLLDFLCQAPDVMPNVCVDQLAVVEGNRGMHDFSGDLNVRYPEIGALRYRATANADTPMSISITSDRHRFMIDEPAQRMYVSSRDGKRNVQDETFPVPLQSFLTDRIAAELLNSGRCGLTPYARSATLHIAMFDPLIAGYRRLIRDPLAMQIPFT